MRLRSPKFFLPPRSFLQAGERECRLERQALAGPKAGWGDGSRGRGESCELRRKGECEGDSALRGSSAVCSGPEGRREGLTGPTSPENLGEPPGACSEKWIHPVQTLRSFGGAKFGRAGGPGPGWEWHTLSQNSCPHPPRSRIGKVEGGVSG